MSDYWHRKDKEPLDDNDAMPFGKFGPKGPDPRKMKDVPAGYLDWLAGQDWLYNWPRVGLYIEKHRGHLDRELKLKEREK